MRQHHVIGNDPLRLARWEWSIHEASFRLGRIDDAQQSGRNALRLAGRPVPTTPLGATVGFLGQVAIRLWRKWLPKLAGTAPIHQRPDRLWATNILNRLTEIHIYRENPPGLLDSAMRELNTAEPVGPSAELARAYAILTVVFATIPLAGLCKAWAKRAIETAEISNDPAKLSYVTSRLGVYHICVADWTSAERDLRRSIALARDYGDRRLRVESLSVLGYTLLYQGKLAEMEPVFAQVGVLAREADDAQVESWHHAGGGAGFLRQGRNELARKHLAIAVKYRASSGELITTVGLYALALYRCGDKIEARKQADEMYPLVAGKRPVAYWTQHGLCSLCLTYMGLWDEAAPGSPQAVDLQQRSQALATAMVVFGKIFPFGVALGHLWMGAYLRRVGQFATAQRRLQLAIDRAVRVSQPYEQGLAWRELAKFPDVDPEQQRSMVEKAVALLDQMGAKHDWSEAKTALDATGSK